MMKRSLILNVFLIFGASLVARAATISGVVSDSAGSPLNKIAVAFKGTTANAAAIAKDTTDSAGAYSVTCDSTSGKYVVKTSDSTNKYLTQFDTVTLDGTNKTVNVKMAEVKRVTVSGTITDSAAGTPLAGAAVKLTMGAKTKVDSTKTDGKYSFDSVTSGATITVSAKGYVAKTATPVIGSSAVTVDVALRKIKYGSISGIVNDSAAGTALSGVIVTLTKGVSTKLDTTKADGKFSFDSISSGAATVKATMLGYTTKTDSLTVVGDSAASITMALSKTKYGSISGVVTDSATGTAIAGAVVKYGTKNDTTKTDGKFTLDSVKTATGTISVSAHGYTSKSSSVTIVADSVRTVDFKLIPGKYFSVAGTITDSASGTAIAGAVITFQSKKTASSTMNDTTGADGAFLFTDAELGSYTITVAAVKYASKTDSIAASDTARKTVTYKLVRPVFFPVSGKILDSISQAAVAGALVALRSGTGITLDSIVTDASGSYSFDSAYSGNRIRVTLSGYDTMRVSLTGTATTAQTVTIKLLKPKVAVIKINRKQPGMTLTVAGDRLIIRNITTAVTVRLLNLKGELIKVQSFSSCAMASMRIGQRLRAGTYLVKISQKNGSLVKRVSIK
jgi:hypothetical protein